MAELGGDYQYELIFSAAFPQAVIQLFDSLNTPGGSTVLHKEIAISVRYALYAKKYLTSGVPLLTEREQGQLLGRLELDELDARLLRQLSKYALASIRDLARSMGQPYATIYARMERLKENKVLLGFVYDVEPLAYGYQDFILLLYTNGVSQKLSDAVFDFSRKHPAFTYATALLGEWDYELGIDVAVAEDIVAATQQLMLRAYPFPPYWEKVVTFSQ